jgi:hypothetical protein
MSGDPLSSRTIKLQRREPTGTTWTSVGTLSSVSGSAGSYSLTLWPPSSGDYRLFYDAPSSEGLKDSTSGVLTITVMVQCAPSLKGPDSYQACL